MNLSKDIYFAVFNRFAQHLLEDLTDSTPHKQQAKGVVHLP
jgi:hypothetical protein